MCWQWENCTPGQLHSQYHITIISDHCPVTFSLRLGNTTRQQRSWRFTLQLINDSGFCDHTKTHIGVFIEANDKPETTPALLWEAMKAYLRGCIISFQASKHNQSKIEQSKWEDQIHKLDAKNAQSP